MGSEIITLGEACSRLSSGKTIKASEISSEGLYPVYGGNGLRGYTDNKNFEGDCAIIGRQGAFCGNVLYFKGQAYMTEHAVVVQASQQNNTRYLAYMLSRMGLRSLSGQSAQPGLSVKVLAKQVIHLPKRETQDAVVEILAALDDKIALNNRINDYLAETMSMYYQNSFGGSKESKLSDICMYGKTKLPTQSISLGEYVSTESLLKDKGGRQDAAGKPENGIATVFNSGNTLVSNIRPYFKKIWYADIRGACSNDVLVFEAKNEAESGFLFFTLYQDAFFDYMVSGSKGTKMPRGDKGHIMDYPIDARNKDAIGSFSRSALLILRQIAANKAESRKLEMFRDTLLPKLMCGEIDVSAIDPTQLNNHLCES